MARVNIEEEAWSDPRFVVLARLLGLAEGLHGLIKCATLWRWQTDNFHPDSPTYVVGELIVEAFIGPGGAAAMVRAHLAEETPEGFRIKGSKGRIEWLYWARHNGRTLGGKHTGPVVVPTDTNTAATVLDAAFDTRVGTQVGGQVGTHPVPRTVAETTIHSRVGTRVGTPPDSGLRTPESGSEFGSQSHQTPAISGGGRTKAPRRKARSGLPEDWQPPPMLVQPAGVDVPRERERFRDWARANARQFADWDAAWRNWLRKAEEYAGGVPRAGGRPDRPPQSALDVLVEQQEEIEREEAGA